MRFKQSIAMLFIAASSLVVFTSALPSSKVVEPVTQSASISAQPQPSASLSYKELKKNATDLKGSKLTVKEKLSLKVISKKLAAATPAKSGKSQLAALLLCWFVGIIGIHRFYLGYTWQGIVQILTLGGFGIWTLIDFIRIITGDLKPKDGEYEKTF